MSAISRDELLKKVKDQLRNAYTTEDFVQQASLTIDDLDHVLNVMFEHLHNWYSIYLPELQDTDDRRVYLEVVEKYSKDDPKSINSLNEEARKCVPIGESIGAKVDKEDLEALREFARRLREMYDLREYLDQYRNKKVEAIARNLSYLLGTALATKLIVEAKGLKRLANLPASSIQVLGAEKALFMHLTAHTRPPKHGIIFLHPALRGMKKAYRGKVARMIAAKVSIAAKADAYSKNFIAPALKEDLEKRIKALVK
ncbi:MAG: NOP58 family protein [Candidatus Micrarchaeota archaeon]|nr:NOP58 family protein [Candidatus Micrarchaeota archaeon]